MVSLKVHVAWSLESVLLDVGIALGLPVGERIYGRDYVKNQKIRGEVVEKVRREIEGSKAKGPAERIYSDLRRYKQLKRKGVSSLEFAKAETGFPVHFGFARKIWKHSSVDYINIKNAYFFYPNDATTNEECCAENVHALLAGGGYEESIYLIDEKEDIMLDISCTKKGVLEIQPAQDRLRDVRYMPLLIFDKKSLGEFREGFVELFASFLRQHCSYLFK